MDRPGGLVASLHHARRQHQLLHVITHSLYSSKEIFLRELISNASDAINKIKFDSLQNDDKLEGDKDWKITIRVDRDKDTLTVSDNGVGISRESAIENLGAIAKSGTHTFLENLKANQEMIERPDLIGQFGVGFYSAFVVADKVTVLSRQAGDPEDGVRWSGIAERQGYFPFFLICIYLCSSGAIFSGASLLGGAAFIAAVAGNRDKWRIEAASS